MEPAQYYTLLSCIYYIVLPQGSGNLRQKAQNSSAADSMFSRELYDFQRYDTSLLTKWIV